MKWLIGAVLLSVSNMVAASGLLMLTLCGDPAVFIYPKGKEVVIVPKLGVDAEIAADILPFLDGGNFDSKEISGQSDKAICGVNI